MSTNVDIRRECASGEHFSIVTYLGGVLMSDLDALVPVSDDVISRGADLGCFSVVEFERRERRVERADDAFGNGLAVFHVGQVVDRRDKGGGSGDSSRWEILVVICTRDRVDMCKRRTERLICKYECRYSGDNVPVVNILVLCT